MHVISLILLLIVEICLAVAANYNNYKIYKVFPSFNQGLNAAQIFQENRQVTFLTRQCRETQSLTAMVVPSFERKFEEQLKVHKINFELLIEDVGAYVNFSFILRERQAQEKIVFKAIDGIRFDRYYRYSEIQNYLQELTVKYPKLVSLENYGLSYESRNLTLVRISTEKHKKKPVIFMDAGIHAMEWIGPSQALYVINQLVENVNNRYFIKNVDWIVIPLLNPDGYEYSHTENRFWRGTRSKGKLCDGVDPNRNFNFHWMEAGGSPNECSPFYSGPSPFSESESFALSEVIKKYANSIKLYLTLHGPAQCMLYPWGYTSELPENYRELHDLAQKAADAIYAVNGTNFLVGSSFNSLNPASGSSRDWVYGVAGINLAYTVELPPGGITGFVVPPHKILGIVEEMFEGIKVFHNYIQEKFYNL